MKFGSEFYYPAGFPWAIDVGLAVVIVLLLATCGYTVSVLWTKFIDAEERG